MVWLMTSQHSPRRVGDPTLMGTPGFAPAHRLVAGADALERGVSLGVMSKSFAMAGLRIGWLATRDRALLERVAAFKDYTTICSSAPSEILALIALRARETVLTRSRAIVEANLPLLDAFFAERPGAFHWAPPPAAARSSPGGGVPTSGVTRCGPSVSTQARLRSTEVRTTGRSTYVSRSWAISCLPPSLLPAIQAS